VEEDFVADGIEIVIRSWLKVLVDTYLDWDRQLFQIHPETSPDDRKIAETELDVLEGFQELSDGLEEEPLPVVNAEQWDELNAKLLSNITVEVDGEDWLGIVLPDFPMNETTSLDWKPIMLEYYAEVLTALRDRNLPAMLLFVVNRNSLMRTDTDQPSQQYLNAESSLASEWGHNFVCWSYAFSVFNFC
jgi:hypothetical protein